MKIQFIKCNGSGNDFVLIDGISQNIVLNEMDFSRITKLVCDRDGKIGADGVLFLLPSEKADARMRIFNADGSEPEMCGNGIRCIARKAIELLKKEKLYIETMNAVMEVQKEDDIFVNVLSFSVVIPGISISYNKNYSVLDDHIRELSNSLKFTTINTGNPHIIANVESIDLKILEETGNKANNLPYIFNEGVNVSFFKKIDKDSIFVSTFERGVGLTASCGTAMSATSINSVLSGLTAFNKWINIYNEGGMVKCLPLKDDTEFSVRLLGNATYEYHGQFIYDNKKNALSDLTTSKLENDEIYSYRKFQKFCNDWALAEILFPH